ncbi:DNA helicase [Longispora fulva]|uniref:DNA helicase IV n=1 Tax=Longispora fulva TaxID=619741 RepID=A0A8J7GWD7_9ACTN|nr:AAA family ATPase [Longispora fulva]MBG6139994.1 DNA helicase IV [Longispora fulva]GIG57627.1 DNA helicase [Longispora fulva]
MQEELLAEQEHLTRSRAALARMLRTADELHTTGAMVAGDAYSAETLGRAMRDRMQALAVDPSTPLFFGRLDMGAGAAGARGMTESWHIGRRHVVDKAGGEPLVLDWRAPLCTAFYQASVADPMGVDQRRRFGFAQGELTSFEDEHISRGEELGTKSALLTAEIERPRVGPMRDIVATIQPEQDVLVRAELTESVCVQGAPGTGKTAVGLHRAAYLLYAHRERLKRAGVLIIGPNRAFLGYIAAVLPALGEVEVDQYTIDDLVARHPVRAVDSPEAAAVKHSAAMADQLARMLWAKVTRPAEGLMISDGAWRWRLSPDDLRAAVTEVRRANLPYGTGRERLRARIVNLLLRQAEARSGESPSEAWQRQMGKHSQVKAVLDGCWPAVTPESLVCELLTDPLAGFEAVGWAKPPKSPKSAKWSAADLVLLDEAAGLLDREASYGHVVLDEAQDLSPMQCRVIARRSEHASLTVLGDLAQGTAPWAAADWADSLEHLGKPGTTVVPLTTGFRVPAAIIALANRLLPALDVNVPAGVSLRRDGSLTVTATRDVVGDTVAAVVAALEHEGSVGVIAADASVPGLVEALRSAGLEVGGPEEDQRITVMPASLAKGLEYDHVIVPEPAAIVAAEPRGLHRLYVVLTRAVSRLDVLHSQPLPAVLSGA